MPSSLTRRPRVAAVALLVLVLAALGCGEASITPGTPATNLLVVVVDTLRADRLGSYGYERPTSPALDAFLQDAVVFEDAQASSSWTLPSMATLFTGLPSSAHRCWDFQSALDASHETLAERLATVGFETRAVVSHVFLQERYGLLQGFAQVDDSAVPAQGSPHRTISSEQVTTGALAQLDQLDGDAPWFLFVHYFDPHMEYLAHGDGPAFGDAPSDLYDGEVAFTDRALGRLWEGLAARGVLDDTLVVFVSDHGEEFGEHGGVKHGFGLHREVLRVPLALRVPGLAARRVAATVGTADVLPTVLELLGQGSAAGRLPGTSLTPWLTGAEVRERPQLAELRLRADARVESLISGPWKLILRRPVVDGQVGPPEAQLYARLSDPDERHDVAVEQPAEVARLSAELERALAAAARWRSADPQVELLQQTPQELADLEALGYTR